MPILFFVNCEITVLFSVKHDLDPPLHPRVASPKLMMSIFGWGWQTQQMEDKVIGMVEIKSSRNVCVTILCLSILYDINFIYISVCNCICQVKNKTNNSSDYKYINLC